MNKLIYTDNDVCGVDEAGRGPLAGPVFAAAVILPKDCVIEGLDDSKKVSPAKREQLFGIIISKAISFGISFATVDEIENLNILGATILAMNRAIEQLDVCPRVALIDGNYNKGISIESECVVKGDSKYSNIAAASILAKVSRDRVMDDYASKYPQYGFERHKGYGTKAHYDAISNFGLCEIHRKSFLKKLY